MIAAGRHVKVMPQLSVEQGITAARTIFGKCFFLMQRNAPTASRRSGITGTRLRRPRSCMVAAGGIKSWSVAQHLLIAGVKQDLRIPGVREMMKSIKESVHHLLAECLRPPDPGCDETPSDYYDGA